MPMNGYVISLMEYLYIYHTFC